MRIGFLIIFFFATLITHAQEITDAELGFSFQSPEGWQATKREIGYIMGSSNADGFMLIFRGDYKNLKELKKAMEKGIEQEDGSLLTPMYELTDLGNQGVAGMYSGTINGVEMKGYLMALLPPSKKKAAVCISVAPATNFNQSNMDYLKILLRSVIFE